MTESKRTMDVSHEIPAMDGIKKANFMFAVRTEILNYVSEDIRAELEILTMTLSPVTIVAQMRELYVTSSNAVHRRLGGAEKAATLNAGQRIAPNMKKHKMLRRRMHQASYLKIEEEFTSVRNSVNGLYGYQGYEYGTRYIRVSGIHDWLMTLEDRLLDED